MKKVVLTLFTLATLAACSSTEIIDGGSSNNAIAFGNVCTRAGLTDIQDNGFGVWAVINNELQSNYLLMDNQKVEYTDGEWGYSPTQYWVDNTRYSFVAVWPYNDSAYTLEKADKTVKLTVDATPATTDYLVATNTTDTGAVDGYSSTVVLDFQHVLTSVGVKIWRDGGKHQNDQMRIRKVTIGNIRKAGTYSVATGAWEYTTDKLTQVHENNNVTDSDNIGGVTKQGDSYTYGGVGYDPFGEMLLIPQTLDADNTISLKITYELKRQNAANWETAELETVLPEIEWIGGQKYTYNVVLSSVTDITVYYIQTTVDPWGTPQVGGTVIIK